MRSSRLPLDVEEEPLEDNGGLRVPLGLPPAGGDSRDDGGQKQTPEGPFAAASEEKGTCASGTLIRRFPHYRWTAVVPFRSILGNFLPNPERKRFPRPERIAAGFGPGKAKPENMSRFVAGCLGRNQRYTTIVCASKTSMLILQVAADCVTSNPAQCLARPC